MAIKVQRPNVAPTIMRDLLIFRSLAWLINPLSVSRLGCNAELIVDEFGQVRGGPDERQREGNAYGGPALCDPPPGSGLLQKLLEELDYTLEAQNIEDFYNNFKKDPTVKIPWVRKDLSGPRMLVMEWIDGIRCTEPDKIRKSGINGARRGPPPMHGQPLHRARRWI